MKSSISLNSTRIAAGVYVLLTIAMTWPLLPGIARDLPVDLGDSVLNCWILGWGSEHALRMLGGDPGAFRDMWNANIFYPAPLAFAYSEHQFAQALQTLPVYALTRNVLLCYNLLFLSTFVLSALGVYLLVRDLTRSGRAGFVAGLLYGFALYRVPQMSHVQVLASQWMPFVLVGLRRFFESRRAVPLLGATVALIAQNLSCGYYMLFFTPLLAAYVVYEVVTRRLAGDWRLWARLAAAAILVAAICWPFVQPYRAVRALGFNPRSQAEVESFSADVASLAHAGWRLRLWGYERMMFFPKPEGEAFPGVIPVILAVMGVVGSGLTASRLIEAWRTRAPAPRWKRWLTATLWLAALAYLALAVSRMLGHPGVFEIGGWTFRATRSARLIRWAASFAALAAVLSPTIRTLLRRLPASPVWFYLSATIVTWLLSLGPTITVLGRRAVEGPYWLFYRFVPGFDGLRVPARMMMLSLLCGAVVGGFGVAWIERRWRRGSLVALAAGGLFLLEATAAPLPLNDDPGVIRTNPVPLRLYTGDQVPSVYQYLATLQRSAVVVEFPVGEDAWEVQYMFYSLVHRHRILNGYSGGFPEINLWYRRLFDERAFRPDEAWVELAGSRATHAVIHDSAFRNPADARMIGEWLVAHGAVQVAAFGGDRVLAIPASPRPGTR